MGTKRTLRVDAYREGRWWVFEIPELDTGGQAASLAEIAEEAHGGAAAWLDVDPGAIEVDVHVQGVDDALEAWAAGEAAEAVAREAQAKAAAQKRGALLELTKHYGLSAADAGQAVGISKQRVYQIVGKDGAQLTVKGRSGGEVTAKGGGSRTVVRSAASGRLASKSTVRRRSGSKSDKL